MRKKIKKAWSPNGFLFSAFRKVWRWSPVRKSLLKEDAEGKLVCNDCKGRFNREAIAVDHKKPVIDPSKGFEGWDAYYTNLFCSSDGLQILCLTCHKRKSKEENKIRRQTKALALALSKKKP